MQVHDNTASGELIEELIIECKPFVERLARKYVARSRSLLDFDDYVSIGMIEVWQNADVILASDVPLAYVLRAVQGAMINEYNKLHKIYPLSLDAPVFVGSPHCLADELVDENVPVSGFSLKREQALHEAVERLTPARRRAVKHVCGLPGAGHHSYAQAARVLGTTRDAISANARLGRKALRSDKLLCKAVGVEVAQ